MMMMVVDGGDERSAERGGGQGAGRVVGLSFTHATAFKDQHACAYFRAWLGRKKVLLSEPTEG